MSEDIVDPAQGSIGKSLGADVYKAGKKWLQKLDPTGTKLSSYRDGIFLSCGQMKIMGINSPKRLEEIYIALKAFETQKKYISSASDFSTGKVNEVTSDIARTILTASNAYEIEKAISEIGYEKFFSSREIEDPEDSLVLEEAEKENYDRSTVYHGVNAMRMVEDNNLLLILGHPGSGKTTFLKYLALVYTGLINLELLTDPLLPVFVPLREMDRIGEPVSSPDWMLSLVKNFAREIGGTQFNEAWLDSHLEAGECIILLDGIDEIPKEYLSAVTKSIRAFSIKYRSNKIVATCRVAAFEFALSGFTVCETDEFSFEDACSFISQWFGADEKTRDSLVAHLKTSDSPNDLCKTPLLLTLLCVLYEYARTIPRNRAELYETCVDALLFRWDTYRGIDRDSVTSITPQRKKHILSQIAEYTFTRDSYYFTRDTLLSLLAAQLERSAIEDITAQDALKDLEHNNGLFVEQALGLYSFSHLTLHEYFAANCFYNNRQEMELLDKALIFPKYREVFLLVLERLYSADIVLVEMAKKCKQEYVDKNIPSTYTVNLIREICESEAAMSPKLRSLLSIIASDILTLDESFARDIDTDQ